MKLSVITVCFNESINITETIESVINQSFTDYEYIIIDGASVDGTIDIINKYSKYLSHFVSEKDDGLFYAMNKAVDLATGEYLIFLNAGDLFVFNDTLSNIFENDIDEDLIYGDVIFRYSSGLKFRRQSPKILDKKYFYVDSLNHQTLLMKKDVLISLGGFDTSLKITSDYDLILKSVLVKKSSYRHLDFPISIFNLLGISSDNSFKKLHIKERELVQKRYFSEYEINHFSKFHIFYDLIYKKFKYSTSLLLSIISKRYLYGK